MPKCSEVANALRNLAERLDAEPDAEIPEPNVWWYLHGKSDLPAFKTMARLMPRPISKSIDDPSSSMPYLILGHVTPHIRIDTRIPQAVTCTLVEPAKPAVYECDPILSQEEMEAL